MCFATGAGVMKAGLLFVRTIQALIILLPSWATAYATDGNIGYVAPVIAACAFIANGVGSADALRVDDSAPDDGGEG